MATGAQEGKAQDGINANTTAAVIWADSYSTCLGEPEDMFTFMGLVYIIMEKLSLPILSMNPKSFAHILLLVVAALAGAATKAYGQANPFDLSPRLPETTAVALPEQEVVPGNPFDITVPSQKAARQQPQAQPAQVIAPAGIEKGSSHTAARQTSSRMLLIVHLSIALLITILVTFFRPHLGRAYRAFLNDNLLAQLQRERESGGGLPYYLFYGLFMISGGLFLYLLTTYLGYTVAPSPLESLAWSVVAVAAFFLAKHLVLGLIGYIFPVSKEVGLYSMTIITFNLILGLFLAAGNVPLAYAGEELQPFIAYGLLAAVGAVYLFMSLRGLFIGSRFLAFHKFHFLLYICTVEIAPVLILARLISS